MEKAKFDLLHERVLRTQQDDLSVLSIDQGAALLDHNIYI